MAEEEEKALNGHYLISFQCPNCGEIFSRNIQLGVAASGRGGACTNCGCKDNDSSLGLGMFRVVKKNEPDADLRQILLENQPHPAMFR